MAKVLASSPNLASTCNSGNFAEECPGALLSQALRFAHIKKTGCFVVTCSTRRRQACLWVEAGTNVDT